jgi:NAD(P)-dependent dehydrogenase (short-subunit alcohol dehydrogenase family)
MKTFQGRTAVITGAGSGFGREFAKACAAEGMKLVLADLRQEGLDATAALPELAGCEVLTQTCDVAKPEQVEALAAAAEARFGKLHLIFNNAGVAVSGPLWTATLDEWNWTLGVNLMGVVHGVRSFVPRLLAHGEDAHVVNTASIAGMVSGAGQGVYCVSKHAVVALSEVLHHELRMVGAKVGVSVLCPAFVPTGIAESNRQRPDGYGDRNTHPMSQMIEDMARKAVAKGRISATEIAAMTLQAVREDRFYVLSHEKTKTAIEGRMRHILDGLPPHDPMTSGAF